MVMLTPAVEEMVAIRNRKIEEAIREVEGSYFYAQHIQESFCLTIWSVRECFADSFILFRPKDIVSGDFYFFSSLTIKLYLPRRLHRSWDTGALPHERATAYLTGL